MRKFISGCTLLTKGLISPSFMTIELEHLLIYLLSKMRNSDISLKIHISVVRIIL